jgi:hypothetical protein
VRPPFTLCRRHCRYREHCEETLAVWELYEAENGRPCPAALNLEIDGCRHYLPGVPVAELPDLAWPGSPDQ